MLSGVGGKTIAEAKQRLSYHEALQWFAYLKKYGTPNRHLHHGFALVATMINNALGGDAKVPDFMLGSEPKPIEEEEAASLEDILAILTGKRT